MATRSNRIHSDDWIILRTSGSKTLRLAETLGDDGFQVWTPVEHRSIRIPRKNVKRQIQLPLMPSYVFARAQHLIDLLEMAAQPLKPRRSAGQPSHSDFSVMRHNDGIPMVGEGQLAALRKLEAKLTPRAKADRGFGGGVEVKVTMEGGSFTGMRGVVKRSDEGMTVVCFSDRMTVKIPTSLLEEDALRNGLPCDDLYISRAA